MKIAGHATRSVARLRAPPRPIARVGESSERRGLDRPAPAG